MTRAAFTLVELLAVLVLAALLATVVALSLSSVGTHATDREVLERLKTVETLARARAQQTGKPVTLVIDLARGTLAWALSEKAAPGSPALTLPPGYALEQVAFGGHRVSGSSTAVAYTAQGYSATFALKLRCATRAPRWLLFIGLTGQVVEVSDEKKIQNLLAWGAPGHDAH